MALVKMATGQTWADVGHTLGLPPSLALHVSRMGKSTLLDERSFAATLRTQQPIHVDWRQRERHALAVMSEDAALTEIASAISADNVEPYLLREKIWTLWACGHPAIPKMTWPPTHAQKIRASNQRARTQPATWIRLVDWLNG